MKGAPLILKALEKEMHGQGAPEPPALLQVAQADAGELCPAVRSRSRDVVALCPGSSALPKSLANAALQLLHLRWLCVQTASCRRAPPGGAASIRQAQPLKGMRVSKGTTELAKRCAGVARQGQSCARTVA